MWTATRRDRRIFKILYMVYSLAFLAILYKVPLTITSILGIAQSLLTIEGILLGLTPLVEKPEQRAWPFFIGTIAVLFSLITIVVEESAATTGIGGPFNWILLFLDAEVFLVMMTVYYGSATGKPSDTSSTVKPQPESTGSSPASPEEGSLTEESKAPSSQPSGDNVVELIERVDCNFSQWRWSTLYVWLMPVILLLVAIPIAELSYQDLGARFAIAAAGIAVILSMTQIMLGQFGSWIATANYRRLLRGEEDLLLYALILMKAAHPRIRLRDARKLNRELFEPRSLVEKLYR